MTEKVKLKKSLGLFDVYAICTGAMFSSGFFLLPGLAAAQTGPSVALAYLVAGILMLPAMFSMAELATAMPRAGGDYFFLDRAMGPLVGTVGGIGTYLALALKSAFALIGMGAYLALFVQIDDIRPVAIVLTVLFALLNIVGAKESTGIQRILVSVLVTVMGFFIIGGLVTFGTSDTAVGATDTAFFSNGFAGFLGTVGFVFVSYAGLTKIASVSEEVVNPGRNIPLGMMLSIISTTIIYVIGIGLMTVLIPPDVFQSSLTPVADAAEVALGFLPGQVGVILVVLSAVAAFASTGNAGILAASRYPLAMGRDHLLPRSLARLSGRGTPLIAILVTSGLMMFSILVLDESAIAKVASAFQLIIFMLVNLAVIVMRESHIEYYDPVYRTPLYPFMQIAGIIASVFLLTYIGADALALTMVVVTASVLWYAYYGSKHVQRHGAVFHWLARLGERRSDNIEAELRQIMKEKGLRSDDPFSELVARASVIDQHGRVPLDEVAAEAIQLFSQTDPNVLADGISPFIDSLEAGVTLIGNRAAIPNARLTTATHTEMVIVRSREGILVPCDVDGERRQEVVHALFFVISPLERTGRHLRLLAELAHQVEEDDFVEDWLRADDWHELKEIMLHTEQLLTLWLTPGHSTEPLIGRALRQIDWPEHVLVALVRRDGEEIVPGGDLVLEAEDQLVIIGEEEGIDTLYHQYVSHEHDTAESRSRTAPALS
jgi:APA family basic amino acid/polyamine antiporter